MAQPDFNMIELIQAKRRTNKSRYTRTNLLLDTNTRKCLFGIPNPIDTEILLEEQLQEDRERFLKRFSFDIDKHAINHDRENIEPNHEEKPSLKPKNPKEKKHKLERAFKPYNKQLKITDFCHTKKMPNQPK